MNKGISILNAIVLALAIYILATFGLFYYQKKLHDENQKDAGKQLSTLDSLVLKYSLDPESLKKSPQFMKIMAKNLKESDVIERMLTYQDDYIRQEISDSIGVVTDSLKEVVARRDMTEELLIDFIENHREKYELLIEKEDLLKRIENLEQQIDTISLKSNRVVSRGAELERKADSLETANQTLIEEKESMDSEEDNKLSEEEEKANLKKLVKKFDSMKPVSAAKIIYGMPEDRAVKVLKSLKDRQAAKILTAMPPKKAAKLSMLMIDAKD